MNIANNMHKFGKTDDRFLYELPNKYLLPSDFAYSQPFNIAKCTPFLGKIIKYRNRY